ncbi:MAG TPA: oxidoreductase [Trebonia sp.]|jgi:alkylation response protein AidB-like acyl-CoA dehydrogenase|nr:oxidoreductase [Trebonia sp.]
MSATEAASTDAAAPSADAPSAEATPDDLLARIRALQPLLARNAAQGEADRRVVEESITALTEAGAFKVAQPRRYGGYQATVRTMLDVSAAVAEADGGTAWVVALCNVCAWLTGLFSEQAQDDVWGADPDARVSGVQTPSAESARVDGGYRLTGRWFYNSGAWHASWAILGFPILDGDGQLVDQGLALIPFTDLEIEETWFVTGMSASGSNCLIATDVFVPDHRIMSGLAALEGQYPTERADEALYRAALIPVLALVLAGPQLGMGRKALELVTSKAPGKEIAYTFFEAQADSAAFQVQLAEAALMIDTAHLHAYRSADDLDRAAAAGVYPDTLLRARVRADTGWALQHVTKAIDLLLFAHGAGSFAQANPLQRIWRDSAVAARHAMTLPMVNFEIYGKALLGRTDQITLLI